MPMSLTRFETGKVLSGEASAVSRMYEHGHCPHQVGTVLVLSSRHAKPGDQETPLARVTVTGVTRDTVAARKGQDRLAILEGFEGPTAWAVHLQQLYGDLADTAPVARIQFRIDEVYPH